MAIDTRSRLATTGGVEFRTARLVRSRSELDLHAWLLYLAYAVLLAALLLLPLLPFLCESAAQARLTSATRERESVEAHIAEAKADFSRLQEALDEALSSARIAALAKAADMVPPGDPVLLGPAKSR